MAFSVGPVAAGAGYRLAVYDRVDSTNTEALRLAREGERGPLWIVALEQTAGRGRRGREWLSQDGNLTASLLMSGSFSPRVAATLGFVAALAVHEACSASAPESHLTLKWPNDLLAGGAKLAGILLESEMRDGELAVVVGIGVNVLDAPVSTDRPATSLRALGHPVAPETVFARLTDAWASHEAAWDEGRGFDAIRRRWLERAEGLGTQVSVRMGDRFESGIFETLDAEGCMILRKADGTTQAVSAGDVYFGNAATVRGNSGAMH
jgi:BirA family biotin operon repressor/biotin-[acetyl-CoA-carboxylase] ligase